MSGVQVKPEPADKNQPTGQLNFRKQISAAVAVVSDLADVASAMHEGGPGAHGKDRAGSPSRAAAAGSQPHGYADLLRERDALHKKLEEQKKKAADDLAAEKTVVGRLRTERDDWHTRHDSLERKVNATGITNLSDSVEVKRFKGMMRAVDKAGGVEAVLATLSREEKFRKNQYLLLIGMQGWDAGQIGITEWQITDSRGQPKGMFSFTKIVPEPPAFSPTQLRIMCLMRDTAGPHSGQHPEHSVPMTPVNFTPVFPSKIEAALNKVMALDNVKLLFENSVERKASGRGLTVNNFRNRLWEDTKREIWTKWNYKLGELTAYQTNKMIDTWGSGLGQIAAAPSAAADSSSASAAGSSAGSRKRKA